MSVAKGAPKMSETDSNDEQFPCVDDKMETNDFIHYDPVPSMNCHNELEGWVPLVNLSEYFFSLFPFCYQDSLI